MSYTFLSKHLRPAADAVIEHFYRQQGISKRSFDKETAISDEVEYNPTLSTVTKDFHYLCVEIVENTYPNTLDSFVLECNSKCLPVRLYIAFPKDSLNDSEYREMMSRARKRNLGVLEVHGTTVQVIRDALSLSLLGLRSTDTSKFPPKYRAALSRAENTFRNGDPVKGCSDVYDEIEALSRKIAKKTKTVGYWRPLRQGEKAPKIKYDKTPWARVMSTLLKHLNFPEIKGVCPDLDEAFVARVWGVTKPRNESAHKLSDPNAVRRRDSRLRTRFEEGVDLLLDLINASKPLKV